MRLKSLKLSGFKSFANPTTFSFSNNITAIVGPNGCGKSNVIDAIRWVLGESSAKQLRGGAMSDVIFSGTQEKAGKSLASVELTFEHTQDEQSGIRHELNIYHELSVRRQVNRDGKSNYFVNGTRCRRRDVVDIFLGTGLGARSYAVIEQGMIGRIVDSSPMQLREFIEEGAGVSRYQVRRLETQKKLTKAEENLSRLYDLRHELEKQHKTLTRQAQTAQQYADIKNQLTQVEEKLAVSQLYAAKYAEQTQQHTYDILATQLNEQQAHFNQHNQVTEKLASKIAEQQWLKDDARDKLHAEQLKKQQAEHTLNQHKNNADLLNDKYALLLEQNNHIKKQINTLDEKSQSEKNQLVNIIPQLEQLTQNKQNIDKKLQPLNQQWQQIHAKRDDLQNQQRQLEKQLALAEQSKNRLIQEQNKIAQRQQQWQTLWNSSNTSDDKDTQNQLQQLKDKLASLLRQHEEVSTNKEEQQTLLTRLNTQTTDTQTQVQQLEKQHATLNSEYTTLHALVYPKNNHLVDKTTQNSTTNNTATNSVSLQHHKKISDTIELTTLGKQYAESLDKWLGMWLDASISEHSDTQATTQTFIKMLSDANPKATNNALFTSSTTRSTSIENNSQHTALADILIPLTKLIKTPTLPVWQHLYFCTLDFTDKQNSDVLSNQLLHDFFTTHKGSRILTNTGWILSQHSNIHLSKLSSDNGNSHFLRQREQQKQRLAELEDELTQLEEALETQQHALKKHQGNHDEHIIHLEEVTAQVNHIQIQIHEHQQSITKLSAEQQRHQADLERLKNEEIQLNNDAEQLNNEHQTIAQNLEQINSKLPNINTQLIQLENDRTALRHERQTADNQSRELEAQLNALNLQKQHLDVSLQHVTEQTSSLNTQLIKNNDEQNSILSTIEKAEQQLPSLQQTVSDYQTQCHEQQIILDEYQGQLAELQNQYNAKRDALATQQQDLHAQQQKLTALTTQLAIAKERVSEASNRIDALVNDLINNNQENSTLNNSAYLLSQFVYKDYQPGEQTQQQLQQDYQSLQIKLSRMGAVNLAAVEELDGVNERLEPLKQQTDDILASIDKLTDAISTIDQKTKELFMQTLATVNKELSHLFAKVFGGGQASLTLIEDEKLLKKDKWRAGLELMAQPKGKKNSRLAVLSGGEKTLTALSLIFAIFKQHPAPFCVLDEVDAPLDDANVTRFTSLINELASDVQFVFISHNKLTMQIADELKGITMPNPGISSLVTVSLAEAEQYLDNHASNNA